MNTERKNIMKTDAMKILDSAAGRELMAKLYGGDNVESNVKRYKDLVEKFEKEFGDKDVKMFTSPGRTEISGNHTDHNHGKVLAGSINLDCVGRLIRTLNSRNTLTRYAVFLIENRYSL